MSEAISRRPLRHVIPHIASLVRATCYTSFAIEDFVTQVGVGAIAGRTKEHFGSTDAKVVLLRRMWLREVAAMLAGEPLTEWKIPKEPLELLAA
jgi:hypothetical protein